MVSRKAFLPATSSMAKFLMSPGNSQLNKEGFDTVDGSEISP